jgi:hypothetical protein
MPEAPSAAPVAEAPAAAIDTAAPVAEAPAAIEAKNPYEFELDVKGQKQKMVFKDQQQLVAVLQKALYADQVIKDASQAKKGAETFMEMLKTAEGRKKVFSDPAIGVDYKKMALEIVNEMIDDEKLSPEQRELRDSKTELARYKEMEAKAKADAAAREEAEKNQKMAVELRGQIVGAMKKFPDIPQTQATMDACIQNMRAGFKRFGKHLTADQAMTVYSQQYWNSFMTTFEKLTDEQIASRFGEKKGQAIINRIQKLKLAELKGSMDPNKKKNPVAASANGKPKKNMTEREFEHHFQQLAGGI